MSISATTWTVARQTSQSIIHQLFNVGEILAKYMLIDLQYRWNYVVRISAFSSLLSRLIPDIFIFCLEYKHRVQVFYIHICLIVKNKETDSSSKKNSSDSSEKAEVTRKNIQREEKNKNPIFKPKSEKAWKKQSLEMLVAGKQFFQRQSLQILK